MEKILDEELFNQIHNLAINRNLTDKEVLREALIIYREYIDLLNEFDMWDRIADSDFMEFKKNYGNSIS